MNLVGWRKRPEAGSMWAIRFMELFAITFGRAAVFVLLYPVVLYFALVRADERRASQDFLARVYRRKPKWHEIFAQFMTFARVTTDRVFIMSGRTSNIRIRYFGTEPLVDLVQDAQGGVFLAAHFGSFEAARMVAVEHPQVQMRIVVDDEINPNFMRRMAEIDPEFILSIISPHQSAASLGVEIAAAMRESQWVGFLADRVFDSDRVIEVDFLDGKARLPAGPFMVAAAFKAPVIAIFPIFVDGGYDVHCEVLTTGLKTSRKDRQQDIQLFAQRYMDCLEKYVKRAPDNWFNFYDYFI